MANFIFQETQRFRQFWIWAILILVIGFALGSTFFSTEENLDWQHSIPFGIVGLVFLLLLKLVPTLDMVRTKWQRNRLKPVSLN